MKQILQSLNNGETEIADVPVPSVQSGQLLIQTTSTLISVGTERMLVEFGRASLVGKARQQPDRVRMAMQKIKTDGLWPTIDAVRHKLEQPLPLGYCNVGTVSEIGKGAVGFKVGDRVVSNGKHAEVVSVPTNLCAKVPDTVSDEEAVFTVVGAVALQGIRLAKPTLGEAFVVTGLGLIGLLTVQLLRAHGCRVLGLDFDERKVELARKFGAEVGNLAKGEDPIRLAEIFSRGRGVDSVIVTAATKSSEPIRQAALMSRKRGRIVLVGVAGLELSREDFFKKELTFQVSASYGPGRYDPQYEEKGLDYPVGFVRWTEQRNFEAVLDMMADGRLDVKSLISHRYDVDEAEKAFKLVAESDYVLGILLAYRGLNITSDSRTVKLNEPRPFSSMTALMRPSVSFIGAGNYATSILIPAFQKNGIHLHSVASSSGVSGLHAGRKFGFEETTTDPNRIITEIGTHAVVITTRHNTHANFVVKCLKAGKHVFVEKPLCVTLSELRDIEKAYIEAQNAFPRPPVLMIGFNRRFAPHVQKIKRLLTEVVGPKSFVMTVNAGAIPADHWIQDVKLGGGRLIGEACHFIDLLRFLAGSAIVSWRATFMDSVTQDTVSLYLDFKDGSIGTVHYFANGSKVFPKERLEVFSAGRVLQLDNFRRLQGFGWPGFKRMSLWRQDKGQKICVESFIQAIKGCTSDPIPFDEIIEVSRVSIELAEGSK